MPTRVLIVDDDVRILNLLDMQLRKDGFEVVKATSGHVGLRLAFEEQPEVIVLDIMMPGMDGFEVCRRLRELTDACILFTSAMNQTEHIINGLQMGGDDYVIKPYDGKELITRIRACLRRRERFKTVPPEIAEDEPPIPTDTARRLVYMKDRTVQLTPKEFEVFEFLMRHLGNVLSSDAVLANVWGPEYIGERVLLEQVIHRLRSKVEKDPANPEHIITVRGSGYVFEHNNKD